MLNIHSKDKIFIYIISVISVSLVLLYLFINRPVHLECRYGPYVDKNGMNRTDPLPFSFIKINKITKRLTFYHLGHINLIDESLSVSNSVRFRTVRNSFETKFIKQKKLDENEKKNLKNKDQEFLWPELINQEYRISLYRPTLLLTIEWKNPENEYVKKIFPNGRTFYSCSYPKKKKKKKYKKPKNKI